MQKIEHYEVTNPSGEASITFNLIPDTYTDLYLQVSARNTAVNTAMAIRVNGSSSAIYSWRTLTGYGSGVESLTQAIAAGYNTYWLFYGVASSYTSNTFTNTEIYLPNYTSSNSKSVSVTAVGENNATTSYQNLTAGLWSNTAAISSITILSDPGGSASNLAQYSSATLYGITAGSDGTTVVS